MGRFKSPGQAQRFLSVHDQTAALFRPKRHRLSARFYRYARNDAFDLWNGYLREKAPEFHVLETLFNLDTRQVTHETVIDLIHREPDLRGLYVAGGGMEGAIAGLREVRDPGQIALVVQEVTTESRSALRDEYGCFAIGTPIEQTSEAVTTAMVTAVRDGRAPSYKFFGPVFVKP